MQAHVRKLLQKFTQRQQIDPALKRAYPGLPDYLLKRHSALLTLALEEQRYG